MLQEVLANHGLSDDKAKNVILPMQRLHALRTIVKGHASIEKKKKAEFKARSEFGTLRAHFKNQVSDCEIAFNAVLESLGVILER